MNIAGNRWLNISLDALIIVTAAVVLYVMTVGGIELDAGLSLPGLGRLNLTVNKLTNPFLALLALVILKLLLARPAPFTRFSLWSRRNGRTLTLSALIIVIASLPRLWDLSAHSLNSDELLWFERGEKLIYGMRAHEFKEATAHLGHPGIIPAALIGASYTYFGKGASTFSYNLMDKITAARLPIAITGIVTCLLLYLVGRCVYGEGASFWAATFLALYPAHISLSRIAHIDSSLTLFFMLSLLCYLVYARECRLSWKIASAVFFGLALLTKAPAFLLPFILLVWKSVACLWGRRRKYRFWEASDLLWFGVGIGIYLSLFTKLWYEPYEVHWTRFTTFLPRSHMLVNVLDRIASYPWLQLTACLCIAYILLKTLRTGRYASSPLLNAVTRVLFAVLLILATLSFVQLFHKALVNEIYLSTKVYTIENKGHLKFWMGQLVSYPPRWFYPYLLLISTPPLMIFFLMYGLGRSCFSVYNRREDWDALLMAILAPLVFIAIMSLGHKMAFRYICPVLPFVCLLSGTGVSGIINALAAMNIAKSVPKVKYFLNCLAGVLIVVTCLVPIYYLMPQFEIYHNIVVGGPAGAARHLSVGWGVGTKEAVEYIKTHGHEEDSVYALGLSSEFRYYWDKAVQPPPFDVLINYTKPPHADWLVIPLGHRMKRREKRMLRMAESFPRVHSVRKYGIDFVDIYRVEDEPETTGETYEAEELRSDVGEVTPDEAAAQGSALKATATGRRGMLAYGPYMRYAEGCWRATFRLKAESTKGEEPIGLLFVSGMKTKNVLGSIVLHPTDFGSAGDYQEFAVDFCIERPRRLQFCVEFFGVANLWLDRISVSKIPGPS
jgi:4-amino-4-deoxy-L-arabinose transferase-like glycosyltransferase